MSKILPLRRNWQPAQFYDFVGGPHDGTVRLMAPDMKVMAVVGTCPAVKMTYRRKPWQQDDPDAPEDGEIIVKPGPLHHPGCGCPAEWYGMQEYRVESDGKAHYAGRRPNPETEDDEAEQAPRLWVPGVDAQQ